MTMNRGVTIEYGNFAPGAKEAFAPSVENVAQFFGGEQLQQYGLEFPDYGNPCEPYSVSLNGTVRIFPNDPENRNMGLWSAEISGADGSFAHPPVLELEASESFSSDGITLTFDALNSIFPRTVDIEWHNNGSLVESETFTPNAPVYFCEKSVSDYNKVRIVFENLNMPHCRMKLRSVDYGYGTIFVGSELRSVKATQEINPISSEISINTVDFTLDSKSDVNYSFRKKQPLTVKINGETVATTFVRKATRRGKRLWDIQSEDYIGIMADTPYPGNLYDGADVLTEINKIFLAANVPYSISAALESALTGQTLNGWIPYSDCRTALMQIAFAYRFAVDTSGSGAVRLFLLPSTVSQTLPLGRIRQGQRFVDDDPVTAVELTAHKFSPLTDAENRVMIYRATSADVSSGSVIVRFDEPYHTLQLAGSGAASATLIQHPNYAVISGMTSTECYLWGYPYKHEQSTHRRENEERLGSALENVKTVSPDATLVNKDNAENILDAAYSYLTSVNSTEMTIIDCTHGIGGDPITYGTEKYGQTKYGSLSQYSIAQDAPVNVGDLITAATEYLGDVTGRIIRASYNLKLGVLDREVTVK